MAEVEKVHFLTEAIYKNLLDNFSPGVKQLISSGRAFQKTLHAVVNSSKVYVDCIYGLARSAQVCKGATSEIGAALLQIAEVHKEINTQVLDNIKTFHSELLIPLESCHENELKQMQGLHKKYMTGHKYHLTPYEKAQMALKKQKKKNKNKFGFDQKELQYSREVKECVIKLEEYHSNQLREALVAERQKYCGLMEKICTVVRNYASHHSKAHELLTHRLSEWSDLCRNPHILPESSELVVQAFRNAHQDNMYSTTEEMQDMRRRASLEYARQGSNSGSNPGSNQDSDSITYGTSHRMPSHDPYHSGPLANGMMMSQDDYAVAGLQRSITFHDSPGPHGRQKVRAVYSHQANGDSQLTFNEGDVVSLLGEPRDGWQYGESMRTHRMGWFPISFTQPLQTGSADAHVSMIPTLGLSGRVKSLGNLREVTDEDYQLQQAGSSGQPLNSGYSDSDSGHGVDIGGGSKRPNSLYHHTNIEPNKSIGRLHKRVSWCEGWSPHKRSQSMLCVASALSSTSTEENHRIITSRALPPPPIRRFPPPHGIIPLRLPRLGIKSCLMQVPEFGGIDNTLSINTHQQATRSTPSPPLPPPPPPTNNPPTQHHRVVNHPRDHSPAMPPPPPPLNSHHQHHYQQARFLQTANTSPLLNTSGLPPPSPMYEYHPRNNNSNNPQMTPGVDKREYSNSNPQQQQQNQLSSYSPASSGYSSNASSGYGGNGNSGNVSNRQNNSSNYATSNYMQSQQPADKFPPPPSNLPPPPPTTEDDDTRNSPFGNVTLKQTKTRDRSAPRMK